MDLLTDVLRALRLQGTVYFRADFAAPWGMDFGESHVSNFHYVVQGACWVWTTPDSKARRLGPGELVVFPHGSAHALAHSEDAELVPATELIAGTGRVKDSRQVFGGDGPATATVICGHFEYDRGTAHPLWQALPGTIHIDGRGEPGDWFATATKMTLIESSSGELGARAVVDRLAEILLIQVIRAYAARKPDKTGFLAAMSDRCLARALEQVHARPAHGWTVQSLAETAGLSRSAFAELFQRLVGMSPMRYVTVWRMHKARELLTSTDAADAPIADIAESVGYESEWSFAKAFKRVFGVGPGAVRKQRRSA